ncbi:MAG: hypothetical protein KDD58_08705 [Bdellovibrionales bacterium]|nr:hypothetical protein [Bdellovibrionales bacterium]
MASCPNCGANLNEDFGLVSCSSCGASLFIEMDGSVQSQKQDDYNDGTSLEIVSDAESFEQLGAHQSLDNINSDDVLVENFQLDEKSYEEPVEELYEVPAEEAVDEPVEELYEMPAEEPDFNLSDEESNIETEYIPVEVDPVLEPAAESSIDSTTEAAMQEVVEFGNSEISQASEGLYVYTLRIDGIDSNDVKSHLHSILSNSRLKLNASELISTIKSGHLTIRNLNPIKAYVIINEAKNLPIDIFWEQHDITS